MVTLRVIVDSILEGSPRGIARYTEGLTRALIANAPRDCEVAGVVAAASDLEYDELLARLPGLAGLHKTTLGRRELYAAWQHGITTLPIGGMVHATTLLAPLKSHDRAATPGEQTVVTIHDATPWLFPDGSSRAGWVRHMAKRAKKTADAIVVPSHAVAADLEHFVGFGERVRVIGGAVNPTLALPDADDAAGIAARLRLPEEYLLMVGGMQPHKGVDALFAALALPEAPDIPLVLVGPDRHGDRTLEISLAEAGLAPERVHHLGFLPDPELAVVLAQATALVVPSLNEGFGLTAVEAFSFGTPVVHSDAPALLEVADGAGVVVERDPAESYPRRLAEALADTLADTELLERLEIVGRDRAKAFSWRDSAERVWQLHADL